MCLILLVKTQANRVFCHNKDKQTIKDAIKDLTIK